MGPWKKLFDTSKISTHSPVLIPETTPQLLCFTRLQVWKIRVHRAPAQGGGKCSAGCTSPRHEASAAIALHGGCVEALTQVVSVNMVQKSISTYERADAYAEAHGCAS